MLTLWLLPFTLVMNKCRSTLLFLNVLLSCSVIITFKTKSIFIFYVFFEFSILPITLIVFLYGYQPEKLSAAISLLIYTVVGRLPLLAFIVYGNEFRSRAILMTLSVTLGFMVKTPMFILHTWLPKAHVEAPVGGSMVLAGVLLKLGSFGLLRFLPLIKMSTILFLYIRLSLLGSTVCALICLRQGDLKILIAYSSVVHMGVVSLGFLRGTESGYVCGILMVFAHGLRSPFLFALSFNLYESSHSRLLINNLISNPLMIGSFMGLVSLNIGVPPSMGLWSEVFLSIVLMSILSYAVPWLIAIFFFGALYNLYLYTACAHGKFNHFITSQFHIYPIIQVVFCSYGSFFCLDIFHP